MLMSLGPEVAGLVIRHLEEETVEQLTLELARLDRVTPTQKAAVVTEFFESAKAQQYIAEGGVSQARELLESAFGSERAEEMVKRIVAAMQVVPFEFLRNADASQILSFIQDEHPQTIALILAYLPASSAAIILGKLPPEMRTDVAGRIAMMEQTPPEVIKRVEQVLEKKVSSVISQEMTQAGGPKALVDLLNRVDRSTERLIIENLSETAPELADTVRNMMFVFEDVVVLEDKAIQALLKDVDAKELATALKGVNANVQEKIYKNMSERAQAMLKEDMEFMGPVRMRVVEEAQQKIVAVIRRLEESGEIVVSRSSEEDVLV
jgi:flagellar motor switch protein FliG